MKCPHCGLENPDSAAECDCGYDFIQEKWKLPKYTREMEKPPLPVSPDNTVADFFSFRLFITPKLLIVLYVLGIIAITIQGIIIILSAGFRNGTPLLIIVGAATVILGNFSWRVTCEFLFLLFSILISVNKRLRESEPAKTS